jgi:hypothetical protein
MLKYKKNCNICKIVKVDGKLLARIYETSFYVPGSKDSLQRVARDHEGYFSYPGLLNHAKKHQFIDSAAYTDALMKTADDKAQAGAVRKAVKAVDAVQRVIDIGMERLENEEINVDTNQLLRAGQIKLTQESKEKDQQLAMLDMMAHFISGESAGSERVYHDPILDQ